MEQTATAVDPKTSRFELAPPRRFILPAILLLLSERPGHGYGLLPGLREFGFGHVDRPAVYRALSQLEGDGLVVAPAPDSKVGRARRIYRVTPEGERVLRAWMCVIMEEHDRLERVVRRYQATGTTDAVLADLEGFWWTSLGSGRSAVSPTDDSRWHPTRGEVGGADRDAVGAGSASAEPSGTRHRGVPPPVPGPAPRTAGTSAVREVRRDQTPRVDQAVRGLRGPGGPREPVSRQLRLDPGRSAVLIDARSTVGPMSFGAVGLTGRIEACFAGESVCPDMPAEGLLEIPVAALRSGNDLYDAELRRRIDAKRHPVVSVHLTGCSTAGSVGRYRLAGEVTFHGVTRAAEGTVALRPLGGGRIVIDGEQVFDIRDFAIPSPTVLMLRIYPDIRVRLHAEATWKELE